MVSLWGRWLPYHMTIYTGRAENSTGPLGGCVVNEKVDVILQNSDPLKHDLFFDNFLQTTTFLLI